MQSMSARRGVRPDESVIGIARYTWDGAQPVRVGVKLHEAYRPVRVGCSRCQSYWEANGKIGAVRRLEPLHDGRIITAHRDDRQHRTGTYGLAGDVGHDHRIRTLIRSSDVGQRERGTGRTR